jgi:hypothetical protein
MKKKKNEPADGLPCNGPFSPISCPIIPSPSDGLPVRHDSEGATDYPWWRRAMNDKELNDGASGATRRQTVAAELGGGVVGGG